MSLDVTTTNGVTVATVLDRSLDAAHAAGLRDGVAALVDGGASALVLDLSGVRFLDSSGLGALISAYRRLDGRVALVVTPDQNAVMEVLRITRMHRVFEIQPSVAEAVAAVKSGA